MSSSSSPWLPSPSVVTVGKLFVEDYVIILIRFQSCLTSCSRYFGTGPGWSGVGGRQSDVPRSGEVVLIRRLFKTVCQRQRAQAG